jgi:CheY-like chemotaxis protein
MALIWLVAEDETDIRMLITTMIQVWGHQAVAFENGQKVWDWLDKIESGSDEVSPPALVLMDIRMPGKKGNELASRMRTIPRLEGMPIALMTAFSLSDGERRDMMEQDGVDMIISKPLPDFDQLRQMLLDLIAAKSVKEKNPS